MSCHLGLLQLGLPIASVGAVGLLSSLGLQTISPNSQPCQPVVAQLPSRCRARQAGPDALWGVSGGRGKTGAKRQPGGSDCAPGALPFTLATFIITSTFQMKLETQGLSNLVTVLQSVTGPRTEPEGLIPGPTSLCSFHKASNWNGEGSGTPLQYSCLENPMDGGAWWAVVHGVANSRT